MKVKCEYCGNYIDDTAESCSKCGAANAHLRRTNDETPRTIAALKAWCEERGLTAEKTRFFVGEDYKQPKAFGIFQNGSGEFVVYKNKANGQRAIRYQGTDEAYAVNELWMRLQEEILNQRSHALENSRKSLEQQARSVTRSYPSRQPVPHYTHQDSSDAAFIVRLFTGFLAIIIMISIMGGGSGKRAGTLRGYYQYDDKTYYFDDTSWSWYRYDSVYRYSTSTRDISPGEWTYTYAPGELSANWEDYRVTSKPEDVTSFSSVNYNSNWGNNSFGQSRYSERYSNRYSYSYDSYDFDWDSDYTDWDSDW